MVLVVHRMPLHVNMNTVAYFSNVIHDLQVLRQQRAAGKTVLISTHHMDEAEALADNVLILSNGTVRCEGTRYRRCTTDIDCAMLRHN